MSEKEYILSLINKYCANNCLLGKKNCLENGCVLYEIGKVLHDEEEMKKFLKPAYDDLKVYEGWLDITDFDYWNIEEDEEDDEDYNG